MPAPTRLRTASPRRSTATLALVLAAAFTIGLPAAPAFAHAALTGSTPGDGESLSSPPDQIRLEFNETVDERFVETAVTGPGGQTVDIGDTAVEAGAVTFTADITAPGDYTVGYRIVSTDGHPVEGEIAFTVTAVPETATPSDVPPTPSPAPAATRPADESDESGSASWVPTAAILAVLAAIAAAALILPGRRRPRDSKKD